MRTCLALTIAILTLATALPAAAHHGCCGCARDRWTVDCCGPCPSVDVAPSKLDMAWSLYEMGRCQANGHRLDAGARSIREAIDLCPKIGEFHFTLGRILRDQGKRDEAVAELQLARQYSCGWIADEAYFILKDLGAESTASTAAPAETPKESAPKDESAPAPAAKDETGGGAAEPEAKPAKPATEAPAKKEEVSDSTPTAPPKIVIPPGPGK